VTASKTRLNTPLEKLRAFALTYPESHEDRPWGEYAIKVKGKVFLFIGESQGLGLSVKLPQSREFALEYLFCSPTRYGLGKSGWVTATFEAKQKPPLDILKALDRRKLSRHRAEETRCDAFC
jgi:hypothetical protein